MAGEVFASRPARVVYASVCGVSNAFSSPRVTSTDASALSPSPVYPALRAVREPTAWSLTLNAHVRGCQEDHAEKSSGLGGRKPKKG